MKEIKIKNLVKYFLYLIKKILIFLKDKPVLIFYLFIFIVLLIPGKNKIIEKEPINIIPNNTDIIKNNINIVKPENYNSLENGKIFYTDEKYLKGLGFLKISNGSLNDTVVKLVNIEKKKSIYTVYIKSNNNYTIKNINDGTYKLYFNNGNHWDNEKNGFRVNSYVSTFKDSFNFETINEIDGHNYSFYEITLYPVSGGKAKTIKTNINEFAQF